MHGALVGLAGRSAIAGSTCALWVSGDVCVLMAHGRLRVRTRGWLCVLWPGDQDITDPPCWCKQIISGLVIVAATSASELGRGVVYAAAPCHRGGLHHLVPAAHGGSCRRKITTKACSHNQSPPGSYVLQSFACGPHIHHIILAPDPYSHTFKAPVAEPSSHSCIPPPCTNP